LFSDTIMSDSEDSTVTYTTLSSPYVVRSRDVSPGEDAPPPLPAAALPTTDSPGYIPESDPDEDPENDDDEDPEEDPADYPTDHDDDNEEEEEEPSGDDADEEQDEDDDDEEEEEPSGDDADEEDEEQDEDDDDEEEKHSASADSIPPPPALRESSAAAVARPIEGRRIDYGFIGSVEAEIRRRIGEDIGYGIRDAWIDPRDIAEEEALTTLEGFNTRVTELSTVQEQDTQDIYEVMEDAQRRQTEMFQRVETLVDDS
nr:hypothetical protein [Tanacetum cinerariifolium]